MKRIFSILFVLVLALSFSLVTGVSVTAATTYYVATTGSDTFGDGTETWVDNDANGVWSSGDTGPWLTIQHAINTVAADDTIIVAAGTYIQAGAITVNNPVTIRGDGPGNTIVQRAGTPGKYDNVFTVSAANDVTISHMSVGYQTLLPATPATPVPGYVIANGGGYAPTINLTIDNVAFNGGRYAILSSGTGLVVQKCSFTGEWQRAAIAVTGTNFLITKNNFQELHYQYGPVLASGAAANGEISHNQIANGAIPGYFKSGGSVFTLEFYNVTGAGNLVIKNNTFDGVTNDPGVPNHKGVFVSKVAIYIEQSAVGTYGSTISVKNNTFTGYNYVGIYFYGFTGTITGASIARNEISNSGIGIRLREWSGHVTNVSIVHNDIDNNTAEGMSVEGDSNYIHHNTITNNTSYGIHLTSGSDNNGVHHNTLSGNAAGNIGEIQDDGTNNNIYKN